MLDTPIIAELRLAEPTTAAQDAVEFVDCLTDGAVDSFFGTPCGVLAPLFTVLYQRGLHTIAKEDNAVAVAAGAACAGCYPCVLMQNSGFGQSINVLASLVQAYQIPVLMVISLRGTEFDKTLENQGMGRLTELALEALGVPVAHYRSSHDLTNLAHFVRRGRVAGPRAILVHPGAFGWRA